MHIVFATVWWQHDNVIRFSVFLTAGPDGHGSSCGAQTFAQLSVNSCDAVCAAANVLRVVKLHRQYGDAIREYDTVEEGKGAGGGAPQVRATRCFCSCQPGCCDWPRVSREARASRAGRTATCRVHVAAGGGGCWRQLGRMMLQTLG